MLRKLKFAGEVLGLLVLLLIFWAPMVLGALLIRWFPSVDGNLILIAVMIPLAAVVCYTVGGLILAIIRTVLQLTGLSARRYY